MKCTGCTGNCEQGRRVCDCSQQINVDYFLSDIIIGFFVIMYVIGLFLEKFYA